jgi:hypothetical protein
LALISGCEKLFCFVSRSVMLREKRSVPPPGDDCATNSIDRDGYVCACANPATTATAQSMPMRDEPTPMRVTVVFMMSPP